MADQRRAEQADADRRQGWIDYDAACRKALPDVLQPFMRGFATLNRDADWNRDVVVTIQIPGLAAFWARVIDPLSMKPRQPGRAYCSPEVKAFCVPYPAIRIVGADMMAYWEYQRTSYVYGREDLALALAQAQIQIEQWDRLLEELAVEKAAAAGLKPEPTYQPIDEAVNPHPDDQAVEILLGWIDKVVQQQLAAQNS